MKLLTFGVMALLVPVLAYPAQGAPEYVLGPEDVIGVIVVRHPEFSGDFYIPEGGKVELPGVGSVKVAGMTLDQVSQFALKKLRLRLRNPEVSTTLRTPRVRRTYVLGDVARPGTVDVKPGWRVTEVLSASGGITPGILATDCTLSILRASSGKTETVNLPQALAGVEDQNVVVFVGDVLTIKSDKPIPVYVVGKVRTPGLYSLRKESAGVIEALTSAGGVLDEAAYGSVKVTRLDGQTFTMNLAPLLLSGEKVPSQKLQAGDMVVVPESGARVAVLGQVKAAGFYQLRDGKEYRLLDLITVAQGEVVTQARLTRVAMIRTENGIQQRLIFNMGEFFGKGDMSQNPVVKAGDVIYVPTSRVITWETVLSNLSSAVLIFRLFKL